MLIIGEYNKWRDAPKEGARSDLNKVLLHYYMENYL
jgi:hypothetical protein